MEGRRNPFDGPAKSDAPPRPLFGQAPASLSFGQYMASKIKKLRVQNDGIQKASRIFEGVAIYVNGHTTPPKETLRTLILQHGGQFEAYQTSRVTHMIAENLAESKLREVMKMKKPLPVVHPKWIEDSISAQKRCSIYPYVYSRQHDPLQQTISSLLVTPATLGSHGARHMPEMTPRGPSHISTLSPPKPSNPASPTAIAKNTMTKDKVFSSTFPVMQPTPQLTLGAPKPNDPHPHYASNESIQMESHEQSPFSASLSTSDVNPPPSKSLTIGKTLDPRHEESSGRSTTKASDRKDPLVLAESSRSRKKATPLFKQESVSFGQYMSSKISKLRGRNDSIRGSSKLFDGVAIYVNGQTQPSRDVLRRLVLQYGGKFEQYLTDQVTHMIATHLSDTKFRELQSRKKPLPVVHPSWIEECIAQQKRVSTHTFIYSRYQDPLQPSLFSPQCTAPKLMPLMASIDDRLVIQKPLNGIFDNSSRPSQPPMPCQQNDTPRFETSPTQLLSPPSASSPTFPLPPAGSSTLMLSQLSPEAPTQILSQPLAQESTYPLTPETTSTLLLSIPASTCTMHQQSPPSPTPTLRLSPPSSPCLLSQASTMILSPYNPDIDLTQSLSPCSSQQDAYVDEFDVGILVSQLENFHEEPEPQSKHHADAFDSVITRPATILHAPKSPLSSKLPCEEEHAAKPEMLHVTSPEKSSKTLGGKSNGNSFRPIKSTKDGAAAFVKSYFTNSRLHHIGSWKGFYQQHAAEFMKESSVSLEDCTFGSHQGENRVILHVDLDCFFVSVAIRNLPSVYQTLPVAVAHSGYSSHDTANRDASNQKHNQKKRGTSEISSCNYIARSMGLKAGMFMEKAKSLCPNLIVLPYDFEAIEKVSCEVYKIFFRFTPSVQAMSCDEAYLEFPAGSCGVEVARQIRKTIYDATKCTASVGISYNMLLARLATKKAKPNNVFEITPANVAEHIEQLSVRDLPGVGYVMQTKLVELGIEACTDLQKWSESDLSEHFGVKTSQTLHRFSRGVDHRPLELAPVVKSISAEVNYGVRLAGREDAISFVEALASELQSRLTSAGFLTSSLTLKLKIRHPHAPIEPSKFMGHGVTQDCSKSIRLSSATDDVSVLAQSCVTLWKQLHVVPEDMRGAGIQATRLTRSSPAAASSRGPSVASYFQAAGHVSITHNEQKVSDDIPRAVLPTHSFLQQPDSIVPPRTRPPPVARWSHPSMSQIDPDVLNTLPEAIQREILYHVAKPTVPTSYSQIDQDILRALPKDMRHEIQHQFPKKVQFRPSVASRLKRPARLPPVPMKRPRSTLCASDSDVWQTLPPDIQCDLSEPPFSTCMPPPHGLASLDSWTPILLDKISNFGLADVVPALRKLKRHCVDPIGFNAVLEICNARTQQVYGHPLARRLVAPFDAASDT
ncbi:Aste57867_22876 [Aphanomyces stellatus]|uniref:DNA repair protein REV1 n=1 Tax=Aphanomyces stellatus TaxID=120398 RepID=A0A485LLY2_9STRA|nr:hypothetical protein As57867_022805 [Aphanomyces stellatus]VFT99526.1 Aste57867_22876 [Aphanomyces stellatus]